MNKQQYKNIRRMIRDIGQDALYWLDSSTSHAYDLILAIEVSRDLLAERQDLVAYCKRENIKYTFRQLAN